MPIIWLPQVKGMPIVAVSGLMGEGIDRLMTAIEGSLCGVWNRARADRGAQSLVRTGRRRQSAAGGFSGRRLKLNYVTQTKGAPAQVSWCSARAPMRWPESYLRYLVNRPAHVLRSAGDAGADHLAREGQSVSPISGSGPS